MRTTTTNSMAFPLMAAVLPLLCIFPTGCSGRSPALPVTGQVELPGHDLTGVEVLFTLQENFNEQPISRGAIRADGTFVLGTYGDDDGAPVGVYRVSFAARPADNMEHYSPAEQRWQAIPSRYRSVSSTPLSADVGTERANHFEWTLAGDDASISASSDR